MKTEAIEKIRALKATAASVGGFNALYDEKYKSDSHCDKKGFGFNRDDRFAAFKIAISFDSWAGYYGNSSCGVILGSHNSELMKSAFVKALNQNQKLIFATMEKIMLAEAESLTATAKAELAALQSLIAEFDTPEPVAA